MRGAPYAESPVMARPSGIAKTIRWSWLRPATFTTPFRCRLVAGGGVVGDRGVGKPPLVLVVSLSR
jgi:hypothetical protein